MLDEPAGQREARHEVLQDDHRPVAPDQVLVRGAPCIVGRGCSSRYAEVSLMGRLFAILVLAALLVLGGIGGTGGHDLNGRSHSPAEIHAGGDSEGA